MKKWISVVLCFLMLAFCAVPAFAGAEEAFVPVIRFVAASDTHVKTDDDTNADRIPMMMELAYSIADADPQYNAVDAVLIAGDLTDRGTKDAFDKFGAAVSGALREGTRFLGGRPNNHDDYEMKRQELRAYYSSVTGNDPDFHVVINGYHFIGVSASGTDGKHYDDGQLAWLKEQLDAATKEAPDKPVFFMNHEHPRGTVYGSSSFDGWGIKRFKSILEQYPQVVSFSGHSHYPLNDPRSVWQGEFTAIGTGAIYYSEFTIDTARAYDPPDCKETATCWLVELDAYGNMRLRGYDVNEAKLLCERYIKNPADPANRDYTPKKQKAASSAPAFSQDAALALTPSFGACAVKAPLAQSTDGEPVVLYRVFVKNKLGFTVEKEWILPTYYRAIPQDAVEITIPSLGEGEYTFSVVAENAYGLRSEPLQAKVRVEGERGLKRMGVRIARWFEQIKSFFRQLFW